MKEYTFIKKVHSVDECEKIKAEIVETIYNKCADRLTKPYILSRHLFDPLRFECKVIITVYGG